jgi:two-component system cell cycle sensor histidine kinase/response regulator CckA
MMTPVDSRPQTRLASEIAPVRTGALSYPLGVVLLAAAYFTAGKIGFAFPSAGTSVTFIWPAAGIAVAALFWFGRRYWPGVALGSFAVYVGLVSWWAAAGIAAGNTLAVVTVVLVLKRLRFNPAFASQRDPLILAAAALAGMFLSSTNGTVWLALDGHILLPEFGGVWLIWWICSAVGVLVFAPPLLAFTPESRQALGRQGEAVGLAIALIAGLSLATLCLGPLVGWASQKYPLMLFPAAFAVWVTVRYGAWAGMLYGLVIAVVAVWATAAGKGPFVRSDVQSGLIMLWAYTGGLTLVNLVIAGAVTGRERAEERARASEAVYRSLVEDGPAMLCRLDPGGRVTFANGAYLRAVRRSAAEVIDRPFADGHSPEDRDKLTEAIGALATGLPPVAVEVLAPGGRLRWHKWTLTAVGEPGQPVLAIQAVGLDVTALRRAEQQRRAIEEQMFQTQKLESLGVLAGGIAHDFNNILTGILGHAELAAEEAPPGSPVHDHLSVISEAARRAAERVRQLMAYAGKGPMAVCPLDLNAVVRDAADLAAVSIPKRCELRFEPGMDLPPMEADERQVRQVVTSLIINASEAVGDRPGLIRVRTEAVQFSHHGDSSSGSRTTLPVGRYAAIRVSDTGCGMDEDVKARAFDPFFSTKFAGRGLGLAAVHGIVKAHSGAVEVESHPGRGTEFTVLFPASLSVPDDVGATTPLPAATAGSARGR